MGMKVCSFMCVRVCAFVFVCLCVYIIVRYSVFILSIRLYNSRLKVCMTPGPTACLKMLIEKQTELILLRNESKTIKTWHI